METIKAGQIGEEEKREVEWHDIPDRIPLIAPTQPEEVPAWMDPNKQTETAPVEVPVKVEPPA